MRVEICSVLRKVAPQICDVKTLEDAKRIVSECVASSNINDKDKQKMLDEFEKIKNLKKFLEYFYNALLKYEGDGII